MRGPSRNPACAATNSSAASERIVTNDEAGPTPEAARDAGAVSCSHSTAFIVLPVTGWTSDSR